MEETEPAISDHSPEQTEKGGKDKPNEKEVENDGQEEEESDTNENGDQQEEANKNSDQQGEEEEDDGDQEEEEGNEYEKEDEADINKDGVQEEEEVENDGQEEEESDTNENGDQQEEANKNSDQQGEEEEDDGDQEEEEGNEYEKENELEREDEADTNKDGDQEEEEEDNSDQGEEEVNKGPLEAFSTPKKRKRNEKAKVLKCAAPKKRRKNNISRQQKEEKEDPDKILNIWKRKLVPGLPTGKPIPLVLWEKEPYKGWQEERLNIEVAENLDNFVATKNMTVRAAFALGRALEAAFRQNRRKGTWAKWIATHLKGNMSESYAYKLRDLYNTLGPYPLFQYLRIPVSKMIRSRGKIQAHLQKNLAVAAFWQADDVQVQ